MLPQFLTQKFITGVVREYAEQPRVGMGILPWELIASMEAVWDVIKRDRSLAPFVAVNAESPIAAKPDYARIIQDLACVREKELIDENDLLALRELGSPDQVSALDGIDKTRAQIALNNISNSGKRVANRVLDRVEWMVWQSLMGGVAYDDGKVKFTVETGVPDDHIYTVDKKWDVTSGNDAGDPLKDIDAAKQLIKLDAGVMPTRMYVGSDVPSYLFTSEAVRQLLKYNGSADSLASREKTLSYIGDLIGLQTMEYFAGYIDGAGDVQSFLPANKVVIMSEPQPSTGEALGGTLTGPAKANNFNTGVYGWVKEEEDPWLTFVGAGVHAFPAVRHPNWIVVLTVA